ncbi:hypothetical protein LXL04_008267 [Taraxacum kok-saghyz]
MAATPDNGTVDISAEAVVVDDAVSFGFERKEMYTEKLTGSVHPYERHRLAGAMQESKNDIAVKPLFTICEGGDATSLSDGDVLIFPDMIKYRYCDVFASTTRQRAFNDIRTMTYRSLMT